ncbi:protein FAM71B-like [Polypterus senegalus]
MAALTLTCNGRLRRFLREQKLCPICDQFVFESDFIEVTEAGRRSISTDGTTVITVGIISSDSNLPLPDAMLVATYTTESSWAVGRAGLTEANEGDRGMQEAAGPGVPDGMRLKSLLALEAVKLSVLSTEWQQLKVELPNKLEYRLQLLVPEGLEKLVFNMWVALLNRLSDANPMEQKKVVSPPEDMVNAHENVILESKFAEVNEDGQTSSIRASLPVVSVLVVSTNPFLSMPDLMLVGLPTNGRQDREEPESRCRPWEDRSRYMGTELSRCLPFSEMKLSVYSEERQQLKVALSTGQVHYLRLLAAPHRREVLFDQWIQVVNKLNEVAPPEEEEEEEEEEEDKEKEEMTAEPHEEEEEVMALPLVKRKDSKEAELLSREEEEKREESPEKTTLEKKAEPPATKKEGVKVGGKAEPPGKSKVGTPIKEAAAASQEEAAQSQPAIVQARRELPKLPPEAKKGADKKKGSKKGSGERGGSFSQDKKKKATRLSVFKKKK